MDPKVSKPYTPRKVTSPAASTPYEDTFGHYKLASHEPLEGLKRSKCKKCGGSRMYFCYKCHVYVQGVDEEKLPKVSLPWKIDIIKHSKEVDGKSTAIHAALLSPDDVKIYTYPMIPDYSKETQILLIFPGKNASTMEEIFGEKESGKRESGVKRRASEEYGENCAKQMRVDKKEINEDSRLLAHMGPNSETDTFPVKKGSTAKKKFDKIVFIDCTWSQAYSIFTDERINHLPTVKLNDHKTVYWRHNEEMPFTFLATVEAIYSFLKVSHELSYGDYDGRFDNLLYFYSYFYKLVRRGIEGSKNGKSQIK